MTTSATGTELEAGAWTPDHAPGEELPPGIGPYRLALRRLRRNYVALAFGALFLVIVILCILAPVYSHIAHMGPNDENVDQATNAVGLPIGPTWKLSHFFLGADSVGRDVAVRLLYGGRNSLIVGALATLITIVLATVLGILAGYFRGPIDGLISRAFELIWAFPIYLLGIVLGLVLGLSGLDLGIVKIGGNSLLIPALIIGVITTPYVGKPIRGQVLGLREREFIDAARQQGLSHVQIMFSEILPNVTSTIIVFIPLVLANAILTEAGLSYLGAGVRPPNPSWGNMIGDGIHLLPAAVHTMLVPGIMLTLCVLGINVFGDGVRDALDPRAKIRIEH
ncbi:MAG TPA: ABC transporter permease [Solirubrobacteraceae bacterium]|nr:ABC transporter permease [Solirubrobacteraceae bacterium]